MGGLEWDKVVHHHQEWRLITCIWLHAGIIHLIVNMLSLVIIGIRLEQQCGFGMLLDNFEALVGTPISFMLTLQFFDPLIYLWQFGLELSTCCQDLVGVCFLLCSSRGECLLVLPGLFLGFLGQCFQSFLLIGQFIPTRRVFIIHIL